MMRKIDQKQRYGGGGGGRIASNNGFIPSSFRSLSSYLRIVSSGASTVASTVRSAASAASTIVDRDNDAVPDQVLWAGFDKLECEGDTSRRVLLLGFQFGFQVWDVEDANNVRNIVSRYDGAVFSMQLLPKPIVPKHSQLEYANSRPIMVICADGSFPANGNIKNGQEQVNGGSVPTVVWFYSLKSQSYIKELKFRSVVYSVKCSSRIVAVLQAAQIHCFDVATLQREYTILTNSISTTSSRFENIGLGPLAVGPRWIAYSGSIVALPDTRVSPQHLTHSKTFSSSTSSSVPGSNGSIVAHYAKQSSKQLAVGIVTLGDIGYKKLSRYYSEFLPDGNMSQQVSEPKDRVENVGMVIVRDVVSKSVIAQFKAHDSPIASLAFDPSGTLLVTASVHGHNFNVFQIMPPLSSNSNGASYRHLYRLQRGFTNAVIQDISFSVDSNWIMISSSRGTSHLFAISQFTPPNLNSLNSTPQTLSAVSRIRSGNTSWKNVNTSYSGVIASTFYKSKNNSISNSNSISTNNTTSLSKYHMLVFSSSGCVIQYALRSSSSLSSSSSSSLSSEVDSVMSGLNETDSRVIVEPIQKWNICHKQNRREREENVDIYGENGHNGDSRRVFPERMENEKNSDYFDGFISKVNKKENGGGSLEERNHVYISEAELQMHESKVPLWARAQIYFQSIKMDDVTLNMENNSKGEIEIENIPTHTLEARSRHLLPAVNHFRGPKPQITRVSGLDSNSSTSSRISGVYDDDEKVPRGSGPMYGADVSENGEDTNGVVNSDSCPISDTRLETVNNSDGSESGTPSKLVNSNNIGD
ncbi:hypothetical protein LXL04_030961 [Taraxacum kok-saghyz]